MVQTDLSIEEIRSYIADAVADSQRQSNSKIEELLKMIADLKKQREPGLEKPDASVEAIVQDEARSSSSTETRDTTLAERRNLVVCIDGTANQFGIKNSNVVELYHLLIKDSNQITFYNSGIGTYARPSWRSPSYWKQVAAHTIDLMIAWNFERIVQDAYLWLSENYRDGDRIFMFGFSRGAYQVRCLSAMIDIIGLIHRGNEAQIPFAYELYAAIGKESKSETVNALRNSFAKLFRKDKYDIKNSDQGVSEDPAEMAKRFQDSFARKVTVHFVGAWDTVSSVGVIRNKTLPGTTCGMTHVTFFRHALALDERRVKFLPEYAYQGSCLSGSPYNITEEEESGFYAAERPHTKEVWFAGTHSDIGGGNVKNPQMDRSHPPLRWMTYEAAAAGLRLHQFNREWKIIPKIVIHESLTGAWRILEWLVPVKHLTYNDESTAKRRWHRGKGRYLRPGQKLHSSVIHGARDNDSTYEPRAYLKKAGSDWFRINESILTSWAQLFSLTKGELPVFVERDLFDRADALVHRISSESTTGSTDLIRRFVDMLSSADGARALRELPNVQAILEAGQNLPPNIQFYILLSTHKRSGYQSITSSTATSLDGKHTASVRSLSKTIILVNHERPFAEPVSLAGHTDSVITLAFSPDGRHIASGGYDRVVRFWSVDQTESLRVTEHDSAVVALAVSVDSQLIASASEDGTVIVSDLKSSSAASEAFPSAHKACITSLAFSHDGARLASSSGSSDHSIRIWSLSNNLQTPAPPGHLLTGHTAAVVSLCFSPDDHHIVSGSYDCTVRIWNLQNGEAQVKILYGHTDWITSISFSPDGQRVVSGSTDSTYRLWDFRTGRAIAPPLKPFDDWVSFVSFSPDGKSIVASSIDGTIVSTGSEVPETDRECLHGHTSHVLTISFSPDGKRLVSGSVDGTIRIWDVQSGTECLRPLQGHTNAVRSVQFSPDGSIIASGSDDGTLRLWDAVTGKLQDKPLRGHTGGINSLGFSPDGRRIASGAEDCTVRVWNMEQISEAPRLLEGHTDRVWSIQYSPDGEHIVSGSTDRTVRVWKANTGKAMGEPVCGYDATVYSVTFSPDGMRVASGSGDNTICIWDTKTRNAVEGPFSGHGARIWSVAYSPDGKRIVSGSGDNSVRLWDAETGSKVFEPLRGHKDWVFSVSFSPDSQLIASASRDSTIRLWDVNTTKVIRF